MFLRYMNQSKSVNLDNFDIIQIYNKSQGYSEPNKYNIVAVKVQPEIKTSSVTSFGGNYVRSDGLGEYIIKSFTDKNEAKSFYDKLQYAWINKLDIFEVN